MPTNDLPNPEFARKVLLVAMAAAPFTPLLLQVLHPPVLLAQTANPSDAPDDSTREQPMAPDADPGFLVATIRPSDPNATGGWAFPTNGHHVSGTNVDLVTLIKIAYGIHGKQIVGAPEWLSKDHYDINGVPDAPGVPNFEQTREMYRKLLADRFHLVFHRETREIPIYALTIAKGGPNLKPAGPDETTNTGNSGAPGERITKFRSMSMPNFALNMNLYEDRPVRDQTGLSGKFDFTLRWSTDVAHAADVDAAPSLFTAVKDQLGLRLEAVKGPAEVFVIDHVERPSEN
jgi:uncharacterized protein (TIGR03435 family)